MEKKLIGSVDRSGKAIEDIRRLASLFQQGPLKLRELVARMHDLARIPVVLNWTASLNK